MSDRFHHDGDHDHVIQSNEGPVLISRNNLPVFLNQDRTNQNTNDSGNDQQPAQVTVNNYYSDGDSGRQQQDNSPAAAIQRKIDNWSASINDDKGKDDLALDYYKRGQAYGSLAQSGKDAASNFLNEINDYRHAISLEPNDTPVPTLYKSLADAYNAAGLKDDANKVIGKDETFLKGITDFPNQADSSDDLTKKADNWTKAIAQDKAGNDDDSQLPSDYNGRGATEFYLAKAGQDPAVNFEKSIQDYYSALRLAPDTDGYYQNLESAYRANGDSKSADLVSKRDSGFLAVHLNAPTSDDTPDQLKQKIGNLTTEAGTDKAAKNDQNLSNDYAVRAANASQLALAAQDTDANNAQAIRDCISALKLEPNTQSLYDNLAGYYQASGDTDSASKVKSKDKDFLTKALNGVSSDDTSAEISKELKTWTSELAQDKKAKNASGMANDYVELGTGDLYLAEAGQSAAANYAHAISNFRSALKAEPENQDIIFDLEITYDAMGDKDSASKVKSGDAAFLKKLAS